MSDRAHICGLVFSIALASSAALADAPFVVRADESPTDSLITIDVGAAPFMLERVGARQIDLVTPEISREFDLSSLLATGDARRVVAARVVADDEMNRLRLTLGCDCAYGFAIANGTLSITFRASELEASVPKLTKARGASRWAPMRSPRPFPRPELVANLSTASEGAPSEPVQSADADVIQAREHLLEQLSRAADQGLLEFVSEDAAAKAPPAPLRGKSEEDRIASSQEPANQGDQPGSDSPPLVTAAPAQDADQPNRPLRPAPPREGSVRARTAIDKYFRPNRTETLIDVAPCLAASDLDVARWPNTEPFVDQVAAHRAALLDEFDQAKPATVQALAQVYILHGFGAEAEKLLSTFGKDVSNRNLLTEFARIVDGRSLAADGPIATTAPCNGAALLWRRIAHLPRAAEQPEPHIWRELEDVFAALPRGLKELVAAPLLSALVDGGEVEQAEQVNLILSRAPSGQTPALDLAHARLLAAGGNSAAAEGLYQRLALRDAPEARESLIRLLDSRLSRGAAISPDLVSALSDLAFATRGQPLELVAKAAEIRAQAAIDGPAAALNTVRDAIERTPADAAVLVDAGHAALERMIPGKGSEAAMAYVQAVMAYEPLISKMKDGDAARRHVANELISLGLANAALSYLAPVRDRADARVQLTVAEALISLDRVEEGVAALGDLASAKAQALRATALSRQGDFVAAAGADPADQSRALSAGDWDAASAGDGPRAKLAEYMATPPEDDLAPDTTVTLSGARAAQDAARATRSLIDEALSDG